jgi:hypothetical protein
MVRSACCRTHEYALIVGPKYVEGDWLFHAALGTVTD